MRSQVNLDGRSMADAIKYLDAERKKGIPVAQAARDIAIPKTTALHWMREYDKYLRGEHYERITRAIPHLVIDECRIKFTEQHGRLPEQRPVKEVRTNFWQRLWSRITNW